MPSEGERESRGPTIQAIDRAAGILRSFTADRPELGISDLSRLTGLSTSTVHRMLSSLLANDLVRQTTQRRYALGPLILELAGAAGTGTVGAAAFDLARELRDEVNETVGIHEFVAPDKRVVIGQMESGQELRRTYTEVGQPIPVAHGSPGKAILAFLPWPEQQGILDQPIQAVTDRTITDPDMLRRELNLVRERGWAFSDSERTSGIRSIAAPILDHTGAVRGAIGLSMPAIRVPDERVPILGERVRRLGRDVSRVLGASETTYQRVMRLASPV